MGDALSIVAGRRIETADGRSFRRRAARFERVVADVGTGDGRFVYRLARANPNWLCIGIDANTREVARTALRARRKDERGGAANAVFVRAGTGDLPGPLRGIADEIHINLPWGSLLRAVLADEPEALDAIARIGRPGAAVHVVVNECALDRHQPELHRLFGLLTGRYAAAGIRLTGCRSSVEIPSTSWGRRLGRGRPITVIRFDGVVDGQRRLVAAG